MDSQAALLAFCRELINNIPEAIDQPPNVTAGLTTPQMAFMLRVIRTRAGMIVLDLQETDRG